MAGHASPGAALSPEPSLCAGGARQCAHLTRHVCLTRRRAPRTSPQRRSYAVISFGSLDGAPCHMPQALGEVGEMSGTTATVCLLEPPCGGELKGERPRDMSGRGGPEL